MCPLSLSLQLPLPNHSDSTRWKPSGGGGRAGERASGVRAARGSGVRAGPAPAGERRVSLRGAGACGRAAARRGRVGPARRGRAAARAEGAGACARPLGRRSCHGRAAPRLRRQAGCAMDPEIEGCTATMELVSRYEISTKCRTNVGGINLGI